MKKLTILTLLFFSLILVVFVGCSQQTQTVAPGEVIVNKIESTHYYQYSFTSIRDIRVLDTYLTDELHIDPDKILSIYMVYNKDKGWNSYRVVVKK